jgi:hypothetical protein
MHRFYVRLYNGRPAVFVELVILEILGGKGIPICVRKILLMISVPTILDYIMVCYITSVEFTPR